MPGGFRKKQQLKYNYIEKNKSDWSIIFLCKAFKTTQSSYYRWVKKEKPSFNYKFDEVLVDYILEIFNYYNHIYGYPRINIILKRFYNINFLNKLVYKYMKLLGLRSNIRIKRNIKPKEIKVRNSKYPNIVNRQWNSFDKGELFVTDVTYLPYGYNKFAYLSIMNDVNTGFIVGYDISMRNDNKIYFRTLKMAEGYMLKNKNLIIHSDNGFQYTSIFSQMYCKINKISISLSRPGNSLDNAACETFFSSLKKEWYQKNLSSFQELLEYIQFYNFKRIMVKHEKNTMRNMVF
ncbi:IS3 family transposase [Spiroplasma endosymbiont of Cantharis lateralis]|uniref:IS3 family transposase n=1 Tax=Spiroplasma endosymbiont of Cantharis lateralis TaxID=3066277 RepID=UPI00313ABAC2